MVSFHKHDIIMVVFCLWTEHEHILPKADLPGFTMLYKSSLMYCYPITVCWYQTVGRQVVKKNHRRRCAGAHQESRAGVCLTHSQTEELAGKVILTGVRQENRSHTLMLWQATAKLTLITGYAGLLKPTRDQAAWTDHMAPLFCDFITILTDILTSRSSQQGRCGLWEGTEWFSTCPLSRQRRRALQRLRGKPELL